MLKFTERPKTPAITSKTIWLSLITCLQGIFVLIWLKQTMIWLNLQRDGIGKGLSNIKDTFAEGLQLQKSSFAPKCVHRPVFKACLSSSYDGWAKFKEKVPDVSDPSQNVETTCNSKLTFT